MSGLNLFGLSLTYSYLCTRETDEETTYCLMVAIGGVCANAAVVVGSHP
jgi:hypothetical protein